MVCCLIERIDEVLYLQTKQSIILCEAPLAVQLICALFCGSATEQVSTSPLHGGINLMLDGALDTNVHS